MSEEHTQDQSTSFADTLKSVQTKAPDEVPTEPPAEALSEEKTETPAEPQTAQKPADDEPQKVEQAPAEATPPQTPEQPAATQTPPGIGFVPVAAVQAERAKRQALEAELEQLRNQSFADISAPPAQQDVGAIEANLRRDISEQVARTKYSDYDEKIAAVYSEILNPDGTVKNQALWDSISSSPLPAEAAYQTGLQILTARKYGGWDVVTNPLKLREAVEKEVKASLEKEIRAKVEAEITGKALSKSKTITDISQARSSSGATETFETPSFGAALRSVHNRKR